MLHATELRTDNVDAVVIVALLAGYDFRHLPHEFAYYTERHYLVADGDLSDYAGIVMSIISETEFLAKYKFVAPQRPHQFTEIVQRS